MVRLRIKTIILRILLGVYRAAGAGSRTAGRFLVWSGRGLGRLLGVAGLPLAQGVYRLTFGMRLRAQRVLGPFHRTFFGSLSHRHIIHIAIILIAAMTAALSLGTRTVRAEDLGTESLLYNMMLGVRDELIEEEAPSAPVPAPAQMLPEELAVSRTPAIDFDYRGEDYVEAGPGPALVPRPARLGPSVAPRTEIIKYQVVSGDTPSTIAEGFGISLSTLLWANNLSVRSYIRPGDELVIPPLDGVLHKVKKGETVAGLAKKYSAEERDILAWNRLGEEGALQIGETLVIPEGKPPAAPPAPRVARPSTLFAGSQPPDGTDGGGGELFWPTAVRRITQYFGWRHTGLDIAGPTGTAIYAAADGIVEYSGWTRGYGNNVVVNHGNGMKTRYAHNSRNYVVVGERAAKGQTLAAMGSTGRSTGPHVHFEVIMGGRFRNPLEFVR